MQQVLPGFHQWSWFSYATGYDFNGTLVVHGAERILIDPPPPAEADLKAIAAQKPLTAIVLTNRDHTREADGLRRWLDTAVWAPAADAPLMEIRIDRTYADGDDLPGGLKAVHLANGKSPGETALYAAREGGVMILGDGLIGTPAGQLNLMPPEKYADPVKARDGVRALLRQPFETVLVGDGAPILRGGRAAVEAFLARG